MLDDLMMRAKKKSIQDLLKTIGDEDFKRMPGVTISISSSNIPLEIGEEDSDDSIELENIDPSSVVKEEEFSEDSNLSPFERLIKKKEKMRRII